MLREVFCQTGAASRVLQTDGEDMQNRDHSCFFSAAHAAKDSGIALDLARRTRAGSPARARDQRAIRRDDRGRVGRTRQVRNCRVDLQEPSPAPWRSCLSDAFTRNPLALLLSSCIYDAPLTDAPTRKIDERLIGDWVSVEGKPSVIQIRKFDDIDLVLIDGRNIYRMFHPDFDGINFLSLQNLDSQWQFRAEICFYRLSFRTTDRVRARAINKSVIPDTLRTSSALQQTVRDHLEDAQLFNKEEIVYTRKSSGTRDNGTRPQTRSGAGVNVHFVTAQKSDQRLVVRLAQIRRRDSVGAEMAAMIAIPAASAFCIISKETRPLSNKIWRSSGRRFREQRPANQFVERVVPAYVLARTEQRSIFLK